MRAKPLLALSGLTLAAALSLSPPAEAVVVERVVAIIGDKAVFLSDLRERGRPFLMVIQQKVPPGAQQAAAESQMFKELIEKIVDEELEAQAAQKANITVTAEEIDNAFRNIAAAQGTTVAALYKEAATKNGLSQQDYRDEIKRQLLEGKMLQLRVKGRVRITEEDVKAMFDRTVREERRRREYHPQWIVLQLLPGSSPQAVAERKALAAELAQRARKGEDFAALAKKYSDDTKTRDGGGDLGIKAPNGTQAALTGRRPVMSAELEEVVMGLDEGQVSDPKLVGDGIVVVKLVDRQPSRYTTLEAARPEMMQRLQAEILEKAKKKWLEELKRKTHLEIRL